MKLIGIVVGILLFLIIVMLSPWPAFVQGIGNTLLADPEAIGDTVYDGVVQTFVFVISYIIFPFLGGVIGFIVGYIVNRKYGE